MPAYSAGEGRPLQKCERQIREVWGAWREAGVSDEGGDREERRLRIEGGLILAAMIFPVLLWLAEKIR